MVTDLRAVYGEEYKVVDDGTDDSDRSQRVWCQEIPGRYGTIYPRGWDGSLAVRVESKRVAFTLTKMGLKITQRGDDEIVFAFPVELFLTIAGIVQARRRRKLSETEKARRAARLVRAQPQPVLPAEEQGMLG